MKIQCIMKYVHMEIYVYYVILLHADTHVLCNIVTCRYARVMYYIYMKMSGGCAKESPRWSRRAVGYWSWWRHQQCNAAEVTDVIASHSIAVHDHLEWTNGWLLVCAAQGSWTCCWRNATSIPASWSDPLPRERVRNLGPRGDGVASFIGRFLRVHQWHRHWHWHWHWLK